MATQKQITKANEDSYVMTLIEDCFRTSWRIGDWRSVLQWGHGFVSVLVR